MAGEIMGEDQLDAIGINSRFSAIAEFEGGLDEDAVMEAIFSAEKGAETLREN